MTSAQTDYYDYLETCATEGIEPKKEECFDKKPNYDVQSMKITDLEDEADLELTDDEKIDVVARKVMERFKTAFLELAK